MKIKTKKISDQNYKNLLENKNFLNNQNYVLGKKEIFNILGGSLFVRLLSIIFFSLFFSFIFKSFII